MSTALVNAICDDLKREERPLSSLRDLLSPQQFKLAGAVRDGLENKEIAQDFGLTVHTVKRYLAIVFDRVGCNNRTMLAVRYEREETAGRYE